MFDTLCLGASPGCGAFKDVVQKEKYMPDQSNDSLALHLQEQGLEVSQKAEKLAMMMLQLSGMRQRMQGTLLELDQVLEGHG